MTKKSRHEIKYPENEKKHFVIFKGLSVTKNCLRPESAPLSSVAHMRQVLVIII